MTEPGVEVAHPITVAQELGALTMLAGRVKRRADQLRKQVTDWSAGSKHVLTLPNPDVPEDPYKVGEVRCDSGAATAAVTDPDAFLAWVRVNAPGEVIEQAEKRLAPDEPPVDVGLLLSHVFVKAKARCAGPFAESAADVIWTLLLQAGWTLAPVEVRKADTFVHPGYLNAVLELSRKAKEACAPQGLIPDGVTVSIAPSKAYVKVTDDGALQEGFVATLRDLPLAAAAALVLEG